MKQKKQQKHRKKVAEAIINEINDPEVDKFTIQMYIDYSATHLKLPQKSNENDRSHSGSTGGHVGSENIQNEGGNVSPQELIHQDKKSELYLAQKRYSEEHIWTDQTELAPNNPFGMQGFAIPPATQRQHTTLSNNEIIEPYHRSASNLSMFDAYSNPNSFVRAVSNPSGSIVPPLKFPHANEANGPPEIVRNESKVISDQFNHGRNSPESVERVSSFGGNISLLLNE